jgi:hypothetical protein
VICPDAKVIIPLWIANIECPIIPSRGREMKEERRGGGEGRRLERRREREEKRRDSFTKRREVRL